MEYEASLAALLAREVETGSNARGSRRQPAAPAYTMEAPQFVGECFDEYFACYGGWFRGTVTAVGDGTARVHNEGARADRAGGKLPVRHSDGWGAHTVAKLRELPRRPKPKEIAYSSTAAASVDGSDIDSDSDSESVSTVAPLARGRVGAADDDEDDDDDDDGASTTPKMETMTRTTPPTRWRRAARQPYPPPAPVRDRDWTGLDVLDGHATTRRRSTALRGAPVRDTDDDDEVMIDTEGATSASSATRDASSPQSSETAATDGDCGVGVHRRLRRRCARMPAPAQRR